MSRLRISVIIPAYNESRLIGRCLESLTTQSRPLDEIIVINNNSTDDTVEQAERFPGVRVITEKRQGISYTRTAGYNAANGDIIARVDADTIAHPQWAATIEKLFLSDPELGAVTGVSGVAELSPRNLFWFKWVHNLFRLQHQYSMGIQPVLYGFNCALRASTWEKIKSDVSMGDSSINEDIDLTICTLKAGVRIKHSHTLITKCYFLRSMTFKKMRHYYVTDGRTLYKHRYGNPRRWVKT